MSTPATELADATQLAQWRSGDATLVVAAAEAAVRSYCGWHIAPARDAVFVVDGSGATTQPLPTLHLVAVDSVSDSDVFLDEASFEWSEAGYLFKPSGFTSRLRGVTVTATHGYTDVPAEVQAVVLSVAARAAASPGGERVDQAGPFRVQLATNDDGSAGGVLLSTLEQAVLDRYRLP